MGILDKLKNLFRKKQYLQLNEKNEDIDKTLPIITIDTIETIINNDEIYQKFINFNNPQEIFYGNATKSDYVKAVYSYADFMQQKGKQFSKETLKRIKKITGYKFKNSKHIDEFRKEYELQDIALSIIRDEKAFNLFVNLDDDKGIFCGFSKNQLEQYIKTDIEHFFQNSLIDFNEERKKRLNIIKEIYDIKLDSYTIDISSYEPIDRYFERAIMREIPIDADKETIIEQIYCNLNKRVGYDQYFFSMNQDLSNEFTNKLYNKSPKESSHDKKVTCKSWAELYTYLLKRKGINAYINKSDKHKYVTIIDGCRVINADATNLTQSQIDKTRMSDLTRAKLGIKPAGLKMKNLKTNEESQINVQSQKKFTIDNNELEKVSELIDLIGDNRNYTSELFDIDSDTKNTLEELNIINNIIKDSHLIGIERIDYLSNLRYIIMSEEGRKKTRLFHGFYTQDEKLNREIVPIFSVNIGDKDNPNYKYLTYVDEKGLVPIAPSEIKRRIENGIYNIIPDKKKNREANYKEVKKTKTQFTIKEKQNNSYNERNAL